MLSNSTHKYISKLTKLHTQPIQYLKFQYKSISSGLRKQSLLEVFLTRQLGQPHRQIMLEQADQ